MTLTQFLAAIPVQDLDASSRWYETLLEMPPAKHPMEGLLEWHLPGGSGFQLVADAERAGKSLLTVMVDGLEDYIAGARQRGIDLPDVFHGQVAGLSAIADPDGNTVTLADPALAAK